MNTNQSEQIHSESDLLKTRAAIKAGTRFRSAWRHYEPQEDRFTTRESMARVLRAWRRTSRRKTSMGSTIRQFERLAPGVYRVTEMGDQTTVYVDRGNV